MQVSAEGKRGFILKNWLAQAVSKLALTGKKFTGFCKIMAVTHAKACIIAGCVVTVGTTGTVATAVYVNHANNNRQIVVAETVPTETEPATLKAVVTETTTEHTEEVTEEQTEEEVAPQDMNEEQITAYLRSNLQIDKTLEDLVDLFYLFCEHYEVKPSSKSLEYFVSLF